MGQLESPPAANLEFAADAGAVFERSAAVLSLRKWAIIFAKVLVSGLLIGFILSRVSVWKSLALIANVSGWSLLLVLFLLVVQFPIAAARWRAVLSICDVHATWGRLTNLVWLAQFINQVMPTFLVGDAARGWYLFRDGNSAGKVIRGVLLDRLAGIGGLLLLLVMLSHAILQRVSGAAGWGIVLFASGSAVATIIGLLIGKVLLRLQILDRWASAQKLVIDSWRIARDLPRLFLIIAAAVGSYVLAILATFFLASDLAIELSLSDSLALVPVALLASIIPISVAGWGLRESAFVFLLAGVGIPPEQGLALSICYGAAALIASLPGGLIWIVLLVNKRLPNQWAP